MKLTVRTVMPDAGGLPVDGVRTAFGILEDAPRDIELSSIEIPVLTVGSSSHADVH
jgi:hypothetical protein